MRLLHGGRGPGCEDPFKAAIEAGHRVLEVGTGAAICPQSWGASQSACSQLIGFARWSAPRRSEIDSLGFRNVIVRQADGMNGMQV